jgi:MFS family permease
MTELLRSYPRIYYLMMLMGFALIAGGGMGRAFLPLLSRELDPSGFWVGFAMSSYHFARTFLEIPSGWISDKMGRRLPVIIGLGFGALGALLCSLATSIGVLILGRSLWGIGAALYFTNNLAFVIDLVQPGLRGRALGTMHSVEMLGSLLGQPVGALLAEFIGFTAVFAIASLCIGCGFLFALGSQALKQVPLPTPTSTRTTQSIRQILQNRGLVIISLIRMCRMILTMGLMMTVFPLFLHDDLLLTVGLIGVALTVRSLGFISATLLGGYLADRIGPKQTASVGILLESSAFFAFTLITQLPLIYGMALVGGIGGGLFQIGVAVLMTQYVGQEQVGTGVGVYRTFQDTGSVVGPMFMFFIIESTTMRMAFYIGILVYGGVTLLLWMLSRHRPPLTN